MKITQTKKIGKQNNFTREYARQILNTIKENFKSEFIYDFHELLRSLKTNYTKKLAPMTLEEINSDNQYGATQTKYLYSNFYEEIFAPIPFYDPWNSSAATQWDKKYAVIGETKKKLRRYKRIILSNYMKTLDLDSKVILITYALNPYATIDILDNKFLVQNSHVSLKWDKKLNELEKFIKKNNSIPRADKRLIENYQKGEIEIGIWLRSQLLSYKNKTLGTYRTKKIKNIYPNFGKKQRNKKKTWMQTYKEYVRFKKKYNREPNQKGEKTKDYNRLGIWRSQNKQRYHNTTKYNSPLTKEQILLLKKANFDFEFSDQNKNSWENNFNEIKNLNPPSFSRKYIGSRLANWLYVQNQNFKKGKIDIKKKKLLESIGYKFSFNRHKDTWYKNFNHYLQNPPKSSYDISYKWLNGQKYNFINNQMDLYQLINLVEKEFQLPITELEENWDDCYYAAQEILFNNEKIKKKILGKPNLVYTWLIYNYSLFKCGKMKADLLKKFKKIKVNENIFNE